MPRQAWIALAVADLLVVAFTPVAPYALAGVAGLACLVWLSRRPEYALAFFALGAPILDPLTFLTHDQRPILVLVRVAAFMPLALACWTALWRAPGGAPLARLRAPAVVFAFLLGLVVTVGSWSTPAPLYGAMKMGFYWHTNFALLVAAALLLRSGVDFLRGVLCLQIVVAIGGIWNYETHFYPWSTRLVAFGMNPIWVARHANLGLLALLALWSLRRIRWSLAIPAFLLLGWLSLAAASRGPTLALFGALATWFGLASDRRERRWGFAVLGLFAAGALVLVLGPSSPLGTDLTYGRALSNYVRLRVIGIAADALADAGLFGIGTGSFNVFVHSGDIRIYPHNLFIEIGLENGVVGLALLAAFLVSVLLVARRALVGAATLPRFALSLFVFSLLAAQTSGDFLANEWIWLSAGLLLGLVPRPVR